MATQKDTLSRRSLKIRFVLRELVDASRSKNTTTGDYLPGLISTALAIGGDDVMVRVSEYVEKFSQGDDKSYVNAAIAMRRLLNLMVDVAMVDKFITGAPQQFAEDPHGWHYCYSLNASTLNLIKSGAVTLDQAATQIDDMIEERFELIRQQASDNVEVAVDEA